VDRTADNQAFEWMPGDATHTVQVPIESFVELEFAISALLLYIEHDTSLIG
jgi:hypothetical protein